MVTFLLVPLPPPVEEKTLLPSSLLVELGSVDVKQHEAEEAKVAVEK